MRLYNDQMHQKIYRSVLKNPLDAPILPDWIEESPYAPEHGYYINVLRNSYGPPTELDNYAWGEAFGYAGEPRMFGYKEPTTTPPGNGTEPLPFSRSDVRRIIAKRDGENDVDNWVLVGELWDGRFFSLRAWCDYTGGTDEPTEVRRSPTAKQTLFVLVSPTRRGPG